PVSGVRVATLIGSAWARTTAGAATATTPLSSAARRPKVLRIIKVPLLFVRAYAAPCRRERDRGRSDRRPAPPPALPARHGPAPAHRPGPTRRAPRARSVRPSGQPRRSGSGQ